VCGGLVSISQNPVFDALAPSAPLLRKNRTCEVALVVWREGSLNLNESAIENAYLSQPSSLLALLSGVVAASANRILPLLFHSDGCKEQGYADSNVTSVALHASVRHA
jgi:hypothetical protein